MTAFYFPCLIKPSAELLLFLHYAFLSLSVSVMISFFCQICREDVQGQGIHSYFDGQHNRKCSVPRQSVWRSVVLASLYLLLQCFQFDGPQCHYALFLRTHRWVLDILSGHGEHFIRSRHCVCVLRRETKSIPGSALFCLVLSCLVLSCLVLSCLVDSWREIEI